VKKMLLETREVLDRVASLLDQGRRAALATVVGVLVDRDLVLERVSDLLSELADVVLAEALERCWRHLPDVGTHEAHPTLCGRCAEAVA
jgi:isoleucyl-tRNA synthetase